VVFESLVNIEAPAVIWINHVFRISELLYFVPRCLHGLATHSRPAADPEDTSCLHVCLKKIINYTE
jgi:hypothetical protein